MDIKKYPIFLLIILNVNIVFAQWHQERFAICSGWDPRTTGNTTEDESRLMQLVNAHFNLLCGLNHPYSSYRFEGSDPTVCNSGLCGNWYKINRVNNVNNNLGRVALQYFAEDWDLWSRVGLSVPGNIDDYTTLTGSFAQVLYGYHVSDEPNLTTLQRLVPMLQGLRNLDPSRPAWINLTGRISFSSDNDFRDYVTLLAQNSAIISFDQYPFYEYGGERGALQTMYFRSHQIMAEVARERGVNFWAHPLSVPHTRCEPGLPVLEYIPRTPAMLRFSAFIPVLYGARGITWFTYDTPTNSRNPNVDCAIDFVYDAALLDYDGNINPTIYNPVTEINQRLEDWGPFLMNIQWRETVHGSDTHPLSDNESGLPIVTSTTPLFSDRGFISPGREWFVAGIFTGKGKFPFYAIIVNKDISASRSVQIDLDGTYATSIRQDGRWVRQSLKTTTVTINDIDPGDCCFIRFEKQPNLTPIINAVLENQ